MIYIAQIPYNVQMRFTIKLHSPKNRIHKFTTSAPLKCGQFLSRDDMRVSRL